MSKNNLVIGAFISDDYYYVFEEEGIKVLEKSKSITGRFVRYDNKPTNDLLLMKLIVNIFEPNKNHVSTYSEISFEKKEFFLNIVRQDFIDWFIEADEFTCENGPSCKDGSANVYITRGISRKYLSLRNEILYIMKKAD